MSVAFVPGCSSKKSSSPENDRILERSSVESILNSTVEAIQIEREYDLEGNAEESWGKSWKHRWIVSNNDRSQKWYQIKVRAIEKVNQ